MHSFYTVRNGRTFNRENPNEALSRALVRVLRHEALRLRLPLRKDGFVPLNKVMQVGRVRRLNPTIPSIIEVVKNCPKQRLSLKSIDGVLMIRANQAHTIKNIATEKLLTPIQNCKAFPVVVHGTYYTPWQTIKSQGLSRMERNHIHFTKGDNLNETKSGFRSRSEVLIYLDLQKAMS
ncbi:hypothetical protein MHBO_001094, partial [Bonamia ostreae]